MLTFEHACRNTQGARHYQEDAVGVLRLVAGGSGDLAAEATVELVTVLADGMGGHAGGDVASSTACDEFLACYQAAIDAETTPARLLRALHAGNAAIAGKVDGDPMLSGMGTTVIGAHLKSDGLWWVSVGDSPLYLWRGGEIRQINEDHSLAPELDRLAQVGLMSREEALADPRRNMLRSALTGEEIALIDGPQRPHELHPGDYVLLASDGLQSLDEREIAEIVTAYAADGAVAVAEALIRRVEALRVPHQDNATVLVVRPVATAA